MRNAALEQDGSGFARPKSAVVDAGPGTRVPIRSAMSRQIAMAISALVSALLAGLLGGAHCVAMCGGFVAALSTPRDHGPARVYHARELLVRQLTYHFGRVSSYAALGAVFGAAGGLALSAASLLPVQRALYIAANVFLLLLAAGIAWGTVGGGALQRFGAAAFRRVLPIVGPLRKRDDSLVARVLLGFVWGLVPCGLTYSVLAVALFAGGPVAGGAVMFAFGIGTLPGLLAAGWLLGRARRWLDARLLRYAAALLLAGFASVGIARALVGPMATGQGPFCLVP